MLKSSVDGLVSVDEGLVLEVFLDGEERPRVRVPVDDVRREVLVRKRFGAVAVGATTSAEGFGAAECWDVLARRAKSLRTTLQRAALYRKNIARRPLRANNVHAHIVSELEEWRMAISRVALLFSSYVSGPHQIIISVRKALHM